MTRQELMARYRADLTSHINEWIGEHAEDSEWSDCGWIGPDMARLMATAALTVFESSIDVQGYLHENGHVDKDATVLM